MHMQGSNSLEALPVPAATENFNIDPRISGNDEPADSASRAAHAAILEFGDNEVSPTLQQSAQQVQSSHDDKNPVSVQSNGAPNLPQIQYHFEHPLHPNVPAPPPPHWTLAPYDHSQQTGGRTQFQQQWPGQMNMGQLHPSYSDQNFIPYPTQSAPTSVLYERARQAATAKSSPNNRRSGHPSQRRPWTIEEENSLMAGLDRVKGPHWSQILAMFGPGGTINEILKDRNQVQLKDKARNLKLFFLKSGIEVPYYLQFVTGELKTRAPGQAAKAEAKGKTAISEDRAHVEGVMALAGQLPDLDQAATNLEDQDSTLQDGDVTMENADGGHDTATGSRSNAGFNTQNGLEAAAESVHPPRNSHGEIMLPKNEKPEQYRTQQAQMLPTTNGYTNGNTGRPGTLGMHNQAIFQPAVDSSNTDPALLV